MKYVECYDCSNDVEVEDDFEFEWCCSGVDCGCMGMMINPVFCVLCWKDRMERYSNSVV